MVDMGAEMVVAEAGAKGGAIGAGAIEAEVWLILVVLTEAIKGLVLEALGAHKDKGNQGGW